MMRIVLCRNSISLTLASSKEYDIVTTEEAAAILKAGSEVLVDQGGIDSLNPNDPSHPALAKQAVHMMKRMFLELHPEHEPEMKSWFNRTIER